MQTNSSMCKIFNTIVPNSETYFLIYHDVHPKEGGINLSWRIQKEKHLWVAVGFVFFFFFLWNFYIFLIFNFIFHCLRNKVEKRKTFIILRRVTPSLPFLFFSKLCHDFICWTTLPAGLKIRILRTIIAIMFKTFRSRQKINPSFYAPLKLVNIPLY